MDRGEEKRRGLPTPFLHAQRAAEKKKKGEKKKREVCRAQLAKNFSKEVKRKKREEGVAANEPIAF